MKLICPVEGCGKEFEDVPGVDAIKRLSGHLTGKHCLRGEAFFEVLGAAYKQWSEGKQ